MCAMGTAGIKLPGKLSNTGLLLSQNNFKNLGTSDGFWKLYRAFTWGPLRQDYVIWTGNSVSRDRKTFGKLPAEVWKEVWVFAKQWDKSGKR